MPNSSSRRELLKLGVAGAAGMALPSLGAAQVMPSTLDVEAELGHPMPEEARKLLKAALEANRKNAADRLKTRLPDCSEPCFTYRATPAYPSGGGK